MRLFRFSNFLLGTSCMTVELSFYWRDVLYLRAMPERVLVRFICRNRQVRFRICCNLMYTRLGEGSLIVSK